MNTIWILVETGVTDNEPYTSYYCAFLNYADAKVGLETQFHDDLLEYDSCNIKTIVEFSPDNRSVIIKEKDTYNYHKYQLVGLPIYKD